MAKLDLTKLTEEEVKHCKENGIVDNASAERTFSRQKKWRDEAQKKARPGEFSVEPCWACKRIAEKMGFPV